MEQPVRNFGMTKPKEVNSKMNQTGN